MGHLKTVIILAGGCVLFGEAMPPKKLAGVVLGMIGILWCACSIKPPMSLDRMASYLEIQEPRAGYPLQRCLTFSLVSIWYRMLMSSKSYWPSLALSHVNG